MIDKIFCIIEQIFWIAEKIFCMIEKILSTTNTMAKIRLSANLLSINRMAIASDHGNRDVKDLLHDRKDLFTDEDHGNRDWKDLFSDEDHGNRDKKDHFSDGDDGVDAGKDFFSDGDHGRRCGEDLFAGKYHGLVDRNRSVRHAKDLVWRRDHGVGQEEGFLGDEEDVLRPIDR